MTRSCPHCGDERDPETECLTCGATAGASAPGDAPSERLLAKVEQALDASARLARRAPRAPRSAPASALDLRLRRQAVLLRDLLAEQEQALARIGGALAGVERALAGGEADRAALGGPLVDVRLPRNSACGALARRQVHRRAGPVLDQQTVDDAALIASELADNAYVHGSGSISLRVLALDDRLRIEVADDGRPTWIGVRAELDGGTGGWGLWIVERLSLAWGAEEHSARVWAEVPLRHIADADVAI